MAQTLQPAQRRGPVTGTATATSKRRKKFFLLDLYGTEAKCRRALYR